MSVLRSSFSRLRRAFTLVELVVVIVVLLILMAIAVPAFLTMRDSSHDASAQSNLNVAYRTAAALSAGKDTYADTAATLATLMNGSEKSFTTVAAPASPTAPGHIQVSLHDDERTAHLCTTSAAGTSFCLAMNQFGELETDSPFVASRAVFRSWGHTLEAAACWLPTKDDGPGVHCTDGDTRALGGEGTRSSGSAPSGDLGEVDSGATVPPVGFEGTPAAVPALSDTDVSANVATLVTIEGDWLDGAFGTARAREADFFTTSDTGDVFFWDQNSMSVRKFNMGTQQTETAIARNPPSGLPVAPVVGDDVAIADTGVDQIKGMTWGAGRIWMLDWNRASDNMYVRVYNPATERIATVGTYPNPGGGPPKAYMAYSPAEGAVYLSRSNACSDSMQRFDLDTGALTDVSLPDGWEPCGMVYDHSTKRLVVATFKRPMPENHFLFGLFSYDPANSTFERLVGGTENFYANPSQALTGTRLGEGGKSLKVTANGDIVLIERNAMIADGVPGMLVRKLDRASGSLDRVWSGTGSLTFTATKNHHAGIGGDGRVYYPTSGLGIAAVSLLP